MIDLFSLSEKVDPSGDVSCLNDGSCKKLEGGKFQCDCLGGGGGEGYSGEHCETSLQCSI